MVNRNFLAFFSGFAEKDIEIREARRNAEAEATKERSKFLLDIKKAEKSYGFQLEKEKALKTFDQKQKQDNFSNFLKVLDDPNRSEVDKKLAEGTFGISAGIANTIKKARRSGASKEIIENLNKSLGGDDTGFVSAPSTRRKLEMATNAHRKALEIGDDATIDRTKFEFDRLNDQFERELDSRTLDPTTTTEATKTVFASEDAIDDVVRLQKVLADNTVGIVGGLRGTAQNLFQQVDALGNWANGITRKVSQDGLMESNTKDRVISELTDPNIDAVQALGTALAYSMARARNNGRLTNQMIDEARSEIGVNKFLAGAESINTRLEVAKGGLLSNILRNKKRLDEGGKKGLIQLSPRVKKIIARRKGINKDSKIFKKLIERGFTASQAEELLIRRFEEGI